MPIFAPTARNDKITETKTVNEYPYRLQRIRQLEEKLATLRSRLHSAEAQVREFTSLREKEIAARARWTRPFRSIPRAARKVTKHLARFLISILTVAISSCSDALCIGG